MRIEFRVAATAMLSGACALAAAAQPAAAPKPTPRAASASAPADGYRSAFEGYRGFQEQPVGSWREANEVVRQVGGWQAYAREGQAAESAGRPASAPASAPHSGHH
jgi:hypothetical protein